MKHLLRPAFFSLLLCLGVTRLAAQSGIRFQHGTLQEGLAQAAREDKLVFVDAYAEWCGPCKWMASTSFPDASVGAFFNKKFVSMKIDMEKGEGPAISQRYGVRAYPTLLFLNSEGDTLKVAVGAMGPEDLLEIAQQVVAEYNTEVGNHIDEDYVTPSEAESRYADEEAFSDETIPPYADDEVDAESTQQWRAHVRLLQKMIEEYNLSTASDLNTCAWAVYKGTSDPQCLEQALDWVESSIQMSKNYHNLDTKAMILYALGRKSEATKVALNAISIAKATGVDYSNTLEAVQRWQ